MARRVPRYLFVISGVVAIAAVAAALFRWDWLIPMIDRQASAAAGRPVTIQHLHVALGRTTHITLDDVMVANPDGFPADAAPLAAVHTVGVDVDAMGYVHDRVLRLPVIALDQPKISLASGPGGETTNFAFPARSGGSGPAVKIGALQITDGQARAVLPKLKADVAAKFATRDGPKPELVADASGTYSGQKFTADAVTGALLDLREPGVSWPVTLHAANGPSKVALNGTVDDPLHFAGTHLKLDFSGPDMALLTPLTGVPIPQTPPFHIRGNLAYADNRIRFDDFTGTLGKSDLEGSIGVVPTPTPGKGKTDVTADLHSHSVDLNDLGGFLGTTPGATDTKGRSAEQKQQLATETASPKLLPDDPINLPKLNAANVHVAYKADHIQGRAQPLDNLVIRAAIVDGAVRIDPLSFGIGPGSIAATIALNPAPNAATHIDMTADVRRVPLSKVLGSAGVVGEGIVGGQAKLTATGKSVGQWLGTGEGDAKLFASGGNLSAILVSLSGLQFGNALANALGIPTRTQLRCLIADFPLNHGVLTARTLVVDTDQSTVNGSGSVDLGRETLDMKLKTEPKHFSIGSLPAPVLIGGTLKNPGVLPDPATIAARTGAAVALGVLLTPLGALIPTIQLGLGEDVNCGALTQQAANTGAARISQTELKRRTR